MNKKVKSINKGIKSTLLSIVLLGGAATVIVPALVSCNTNNSISLSEDALTKELIKPVTLTRNSNGDYEGKIITNGDFDYDCYIYINENALQVNSDYSLDKDNGNLVIKKSATDKYGAKNISVVVRQKAGKKKYAEKVNVIKKTSTSIYVGDDVQFEVEVLPLDTTDKTVEWKVSNLELASINSQGLLTAKKAGNVTVTATAKDGSRISGELSINIIARGELRTMKFGASSRRTIDIDSDTSFQYYVYEDGNNTPLNDVKWSITNGAAEINPNTGILKPLGDGGSETIVAKKAGFTDASFEIEVASFNKCKFLNESGTKRGNYVCANTDFNFTARKKLTGTLVLPSRYWDDTNEQWVSVTNFYNNTTEYSTYPIKGAFEGCHNLERIVISDSIEKIDTRTFCCVYLESYETPKLKEIVIRPDSNCKKICDSAFAFHSGVKKITINAKMESIEGEIGGQPTTIIMDSSTIANAVDNVHGLYGASNSTVYVKDGITVNEESNLFKTYTKQETTEMLGYSTWKCNAND